MIVRQNILFTRKITHGTIELHCTLRGLMRTPDGDASMNFSADSNFMPMDVDHDIDHHVIDSSFLVFVLCT